MVGKSGLLIYALQIKVSLPNLSLQIANVALEHRGKSNRGPNHWIIVMKNLPSAEYLMITKERITLRFTFSVTIYYNVTDLLSVLGVGWTIVCVSFIVSFYYNTIIGWSIFYFFSSFTKDLPWTSCTNEWNTCRCSTGYVPDALSLNSSSNYTLNLNNSNFDIDNLTYSCNNQTYFYKEALSPTREYFE